MPIAYLFSKILIEAGAVIVGTMIYAVGVYFMIGYTISLLQLVKFGIFCLINSDYSVFMCIGG